MGYSGLSRINVGRWRDDATGPMQLVSGPLGRQRFYSLSAQIQRERKAYYDILERTQKASLDVTEWLVGFIATLHRAVDHAHCSPDTALRDITDLLNRGVLRKSVAGGRSTSYELDDAPAHTAPPRPPHPQ